MKLLKDWNLFEKILLISSVLIVSIVGYFFKSELLTISSSIVGIITALLLAKGKNLGQVFGALSAVLYSALSFKNMYYGEVLIYSALMLPMYIMGIIAWVKHQNKETNFVEINSISKKEWAIVSFVFGIVFIGIYFLLKLFNTSELVVSTISVLASLFALYLQIRRSRFSFGFYLINDIILMLLWGIPVIRGNYLLIPIFLNPIINFINDFYGLNKWRKTEIIQQSLKKEVE